MTMATPFHFGSCSAMAMAQTRSQAAESFRPDRLAVAVKSNQAPTSFYGDQLLLLRRSLRAPGCVQKTGRRSSEGPFRRKGGVGIRCALQDLIGGDLLKFDLGQWLDDVEKHKALAIYSPHEGGYEGRYLTRLRYQGYYFLDLSARGLGDPETTLTKIHPVCPAHLGRQPIARWYYPPEIDYRLSLLPPNSKGLILWVIEAKVLSKAELQFLALLPSIRPKVKVIAECGNWRKFVWKPLKEIAGLPLDDEA